MIWSLCCKISCWPFGGHHLSSESKWTCLFAANYLAEPLVVISCPQRVSDLVYLLQNLLLTQQSVADHLVSISCPQRVSYLVLFICNLQLIYPLTILDCQSFLLLYFVSHYWFCTLCLIYQIVCNIFILSSVLLTFWFSVHFQQVCVVFVTTTFLFWYLCNNCLHRKYVNTLFSCYNKLTTSSLSVGMSL